MGYILPIPHYQYQEYQNRTIPSRTSPFILEPVSKVSLEKNSNRGNSMEDQDFAGNREVTEDSINTDSMHTFDSFKNTEIPSISPEEKIYADTPVVHCKP